MLALGYLTLLAAIAVLALLMINMWQTTVVDAREEEKRHYEQRVEAAAEEMFKNAEYRVHYRPVVMENESDIKW